MHAKGSMRIGQNAAEIGAAMWGGRWLSCGAFWRAAGAPRPAAILRRNHRLSRPPRRPGASLVLPVRCTGWRVGRVPGDCPLRAVVLLVARVAVMNQLIDIVGGGKRSPAAVRRPFTRGMPCSGLPYTVRVRGEVEGPIWRRWCLCRGTILPGGQSIRACAWVWSATVCHDSVMSTLWRVLWYLWKHILHFFRMWVHCDALNAPHFPLIRTQRGRGDGRNASTP